ncbi:MAG TPA: hypothetical protein ENJ00_03060 [Phycisphaerales bacterium]|nr:hypothetical protein [Phycisphaerales bacterium]
MTGTHEQTSTRSPAPLIIHVGLHKTGTTWLQNRVFTNNDLGFHSPWGPMASPAVAEFMLVDPLAFDAKATHERLAPDITAARDRGLIPVLSHEGLSSRPVRGTYYAPTVAKRLADVFPEARIIIGIREQKGMILSLYRQFVRNGGTYSLTQFIGTGNEPPGWSPLCRLDFFHYDRFVRLYQDLFGEDNVLVLPLELLRDDEPDYLRKILAFAGSDAPPDALGQAGASNVGWGGCTLGLYRCLSRFAVRNPLGPKQPWPVRWSQRICYKLDAIIPRSMHKKVEARWKATIADRVADRFAPSNARLAAMTGLNLKELGYPCG